MNQELATRDELITVIDFLLGEIANLDAHKQWLCPAPDYSIIALAEHIVQQEDEAQPVKGG